MAFYVMYSLLLVVCMCSPMTAVGWCNQDEGDTLMVEIANGVESFLFGRPFEDCESALQFFETSQPWGNRTTFCASEIEKVTFFVNEHFWASNPNVDAETIISDACPCSCRGGFGFYRLGSYDLSNTEHESSGKVPRNNVVLTICLLLLVLLGMCCVWIACCCWCEKSSKIEALAKKPPRNPSKTTNFVKAVSDIEMGVLRKENPTSSVYTSCRPAAASTTVYAASHTKASSPALSVISEWWSGSEHCEKVDTTGDMRRQQNQIESIYHAETPWPRNLSTTHGSLPSAPTTPREDIQPMQKTFKRQLGEAKLMRIHEDFNAFHIKASDLEVGEISIGCGKFGEVRLANWCGSVVAAKLLPKDRSRGLKEIETEFDVLKYLGNHPSIVTLYGYCPEKSVLVMEYVDGGSLLNLVSAQKKVGKFLTNEQRIDILCQVATGVSFLHQHSVLHRDIACRNILISRDQKHVKIADFGLSTQIKNSVPVHSSKTGPVRWMAPESLCAGIFTTKTDVWMFGCTVVELWSDGNHPYKNKNTTQVKRGLREGNLEIQCNAEWPEMIKDLVSRCCNHEPDKRPEMSVVYNNLKYSEV